MAKARTTLLCCTLLVAARGLRFCHGLEVLRGVEGQPLSLPPPPLEHSAIARVTWWTQGTHIAEAKPSKGKFSVDHLPRFLGRLLIHPGNLSLEIRPLKVEDSGWYKVTVDTFSDPTNPKTFSYVLMVDGDSTGTGATGGPSGITEGPRGVTEPQGKEPSTQGGGGEQPPGGSGGLGVCEVLQHYCVIRGYLVAAIFGPLLVLVATIHLVTRDKATKTQDEGDSEPPRITSSRGTPPWLR